MEAKIFLRISIMMGAAFGTLLLLWFLNVVYQREAVKQDLFKRRCTPIRIRWFPFSLVGWYWGTPFRVFYRDTAGLLHKAQCYVYMSLMDSPFGPRRVKWTTDEIKEVS
jgi:hypothetical protein